MSSQVSPRPSPSESCCVGLGRLQLSLVLGTPSPSASGSHTSPRPSWSASTWLGFTTYVQLSLVLMMPSMSESAPAMHCTVIGPLTATPTWFQASHTRQAWPHGFAPMPPYSACMSAIANAAVMYIVASDGRLPISIHATAPILPRSWLSLLPLRRRSCAVLHHAKFGIPLLTWTPP